MSSHAASQLEIVAEHPLGDMIARYFRRAGSGAVALAFLPASLADRAVPKRDWLTEPDVIGPGRKNVPAWATDPLVQLRTRRAEWPNGFGAGMSMRNGPDVGELRLAEHQARHVDGVTRLDTQLHHASGLVLTHTLTHRGRDPFLRVAVTCTNRGEKPVTLEMLSSFSISGITPFHPTFAPGRLRLHRFRSAWSSEGRHVVDDLEHLQLERSWIGYTNACERFGAIGSLPVKRWFPAAIIEDTEARAVWGAHLAWAGSWQIEVFRRGDLVDFSGGLADREFGHWWKTLAPGETLETPPAILSCAEGDADELSQRLTEAQRVTPLPVEADLPVCFNEWCTSWGEPKHDALLEQASLVARHGGKYVVLDNGWQRGAHGSGKSCLGDWTPREDNFPHGLEATCRAIREMGLVPGLWFEFEVATSSSGVYSEQIHQMLHLDGEPILASGRRFWDLRKPEVVSHLAQQVASLLDRCGVGYIKVDYNACLPFGVDGDESPGEGLRQHILGVYRLFDRIRERLPELVIENCASGGHRLEPSLMARAAMGSFSDAHEGLEIPVIAANLHRLIRPEQSLVWAVLRTEDAPERIVYSMAATFLGRVCLSGDITRLDDQQWRLVDDALDFYREATASVRSGRTRWHSPPQQSYRDLHGHQIVERTCESTGKKLVIAHRFADGPTSLAIPIERGWRIARIYPRNADVTLDGDRLTLELSSPFSAAVALLDYHVLL